MRRIPILIEGNSTKAHCCEDMDENAQFSCSRCDDRYDCPDHLIDYSLIFDEYGVIIHDGGTSSIAIKFCPWCGKPLPESKRDRWFEELEKLGFENPMEQDIPKKYESDAWYRDGSSTSAQKG